MKLLHIDSSILGEGSSSRALTAAIVKRLTAPGDAVIHRDLAESALPHATAATLPGDHPLSALAGPLDGPAQAVRDASQTLLDEFLAADTIVIGVPMYNFGIPSQLKAWIDRIVVPGKTFAHVDGAAVGLATGKRVILAVTRGSIYTGDSPYVAAEHAENHLRTVFGFIGVTHVDVVVAEGLTAGGEEGKAVSLAAARDAVARLAA